MVGAGERIYWYYGGDFVEKEEFASDITDIVEVDDVLYVSLGSGTEYYYSTDGAAYSNATLTYDQAEKIFAAPNPAATATVLWEFQTPNKLSNSTNGTNV